jgi:dihydroorotate dehydrogenase (NAD+) catalytic subunit
LVKPEPVAETAALDPVDLHLEIGAHARQPLVLANPIMTASGTFGSGAEYARLTNVSGLGALVSPSVTAVSRRGGRLPRIVETPSGLLSATGLPNVGIRAAIRDWAPIWATWDVPVIVSIAANEAEDFADLAAELDGVDGVSGLELNLPEPWDQSSTDDDVARVGWIVGAVRERTGLPVVVKLSPGLADPRRAAREAEAAGADAISLVGGAAGLKINTWTGRPALGSGMGLLSGPAIHPIAVRLVYLVSQAVEIPVIGIGGIASVEDALEFIIVGASAVQVGTATFVEPTAATAIARALPAAMRARGFHSLGEVTALLRGALDGALITQTSSEA